MKQRILTALWGLFLIILAAAALAYNLGALQDYKLMVVYAAAGLLAVMGLAFLFAMLVQRDQWFYVIPGFSFLALGGIVYLTTLQTIPPEWLGALFLAGVALSFLVIFLRDRRERWWALLQAETIVLLALLGLGLGVPESATRMVGTLLFGGFGLSFLLVWLLSRDRGRLVWALIMAGVLMVFAAIIFTWGRNQVLSMLWPAVLLLLGLFLLIRTFGGDKKTAPPVSVPVVPESPQPGEETETTLARIQPPQPSTPSPEPSAPAEPALEPEVLEPDDEEGRHGQQSADADENELSPGSEVRSPRS